jgi:hypothetical protein
MYALQAHSKGVLMSAWDRFKRGLRNWLVGDIDEQIRKSLPPATQKLVDRSGIAEQGRHKSMLRDAAEPDGRAPRKQIGLPPAMLRALARQNPWLRAAIDCRKREVANAHFDIIPKLDRFEKELNSLRKLVQSVRRFDDRNGLLDAYKPIYIDRSMAAAIIDATRSPDLTSAEVRYRFALALTDRHRIAEAHCAKIRPLFESPNRNPYGWPYLLQACIPDLFILDAWSLELRRTAEPRVDPSDSQSPPSYDNPIVEMHWVDGATVRPIINEFGMLHGVERGEENELAYEQWIDGMRIQGGGWRYWDLMYVQENPQTDIEFRGYGFSRVESLVVSSLVDAYGDKEDLEEFKRGMFGGFLVLQQEGYDQEDVEEYRAFIEEELEGTKKLPLLAMSDSGKVSWVSTSQFSGNRDKKSEAIKLRIIKKIAATFQMPLIKLAEHTAATNYSTSQTTQTMDDDGLRTLLAFLDDSINRNIIAQFDYDDVQYSSDPAHLRDDEAELTLAEKRGNLGIWEINDIRAEFGQDPLDDGDISLPRWTEREKAKGQGEGGGGMEEGEDAENTEGDDEGWGSEWDVSGGGDDDENTDDADDTDEPMQKAIKIDPSDDHANREVTRRMEAFAQILGGRWPAIMAQIEDFINSAVAKDANALSDPLVLEEMTQVLSSRNPELLDIIRDQVGAVFAVGAVTAQMGEDALLRNPSKKEIRKWLESPRSPITQRALQVLEATAFSEVRQRDEQTLAAFKRELLAGVERGANPQTISREFVREIEGADGAMYYNYERLARTETARAFAGGVMAQAKDLGLDYLYIPENANACPQCASKMVGRVFNLSDIMGASNVGKKQADWIPALPMHPNCRDHGIPASKWLVDQATDGGRREVPPEGVLVKYVPPAMRTKPQPPTTESER